MRIAILTTDNRDHHRRYDLAEPRFGPAIEAVLQGLSTRSDLEVHVISCTQQPMLSPAKLSENTWFHLLPVPKIGWLRTGYQGCVRAIRKKLREVQPDVVHGQGTERECALAAVFSGFPNVLTIHGNMSAVARVLRAPAGSFFWCAGLLERLALPRTCGVLCNSAYTESLVGRRARQTWRVPNAVRLEFFETPLPVRSTSLKPVLLNIGAISRYKRQIELLEVVTDLHRAGHIFELRFIGAVDPRDRYAADFVRQIEELNRDGFVQYIGTKSVREIIATMDSAVALVHVPSEEAFGLVAAEALARDLKVFSTEVGGLPDILGDKGGSELFSLGDANSLRSAMARWLQSGCPTPPSSALKMRQDYHPEVIAAKHVEIYRNLARR